MAAKRALGTASAASTAAMVAGDAVHGSVKDVHSVLAYEHRMGTAKMMVAMDTHKQIEDSLADLTFYELNFDGTHSNACNKEKVLVSIFTTTAVKFKSPGDCEMARNAVSGLDDPKRWTSLARL